MQRVVLTARVLREEDQYVASVDALALEAFSLRSAEEAQDGLVTAVRSWIETQDTLGTLEKSLAQAGYPGVGEDTELQLEFVE